MPKFRLLSLTRNTRVLDIYIYTRFVRKFASRWRDGAVCFFFIREDISCLDFEMRNYGRVSREIGFWQSFEILRAGWNQGIQRQKLLNSS